MELGLPDYFVKVLQKFYFETVATISGSQKPSSTVPMNKGVKQGCPASPLLFSLFFDRVA